MARIAVLTKTGVRSQHGMAGSILTVLDLRERCLASDPGAWRTFIRTYGPLARHLAQQYFSSVSGLLPEVFAAAREEPAQFWRGFSGTGQKEFLLHIRRHVMGVGRSRRGPAPETPLTVSSFGALLQQFPQAQREMVILTLKGYDAGAVAHMTHAFEATADKVAAEVLLKLPAEPNRSAGHDGLFAELEQQRTEECLPDPFFVRFEDGGTVSWRDREQAERHFESCLSCLVLLTDYREAHHFFRTLSPLEAETERAIAERIGLPLDDEPGKRSLWSRLWRSR